MANELQITIDEFSSSLVTVANAASSRERREEIIAAGKDYCGAVLPILRDAMSTSKRVSP